jgi:hypothetical protein
MSTPAITKTTGERVAVVVPVEVGDPSIRKRDVETSPYVDGLELLYAGPPANDLSAKQREGLNAFEQAVAQNANKVQDALMRLQGLQEQSAQIKIQRSAGWQGVVADKTTPQGGKFILLWILFSGRSRGGQPEWVKVAVRACFPAKSTRRKSPCGAGFCHVAYRNNRLRG